jgi:hypothetical protein
MAQSNFMYFVVGKAIVPAVVNFLINGAIAWGVFRSLSVVPVWGDMSIGGDTLATAFLLPWATVLIAAPLIRKETVKGVAPPAPDSSWVQLVPPSNTTWLYAILIGVVAVVLFGMPTAFAMQAMAAGGLALNSFLLFKATFAALLAAVVTPIIALSVMKEGAALASAERQA